mmetsp:Transcript_34866/g.52019  ORF Transcript_34866/g.52019 Transcript_34866/m.52019 type:complete len:465 (-) Transcript_34866:486-1880(-)
MALPNPWHHCGGGGNIHFMLAFCTIIIMLVLQKSLNLYLYLPTQIILETSATNASTQIKIPLYDLSNISTGCIINQHNNISYLQHMHQSSNFILKESNLAQLRPQNFVVLPRFNSSSTLLGGVAVFRNTFIQAETFPVVFDCQSIYVPESCKAAEGKKESFDVSKLKNQEASPVVKLNDTTIMIYQYWGESYYHAIVEVIPRISYLLDFIRQQLKDGQKVNILSPHRYIMDNGRQEVITSLLGFPLTENLSWVAYDTSKTYFARHLLIPAGTQCGHAQLQCLLELQHTMKRNIPYVLENELKNLTEDKYDTDNNANDYNKTVILVQKRMFSRKLSNHDELVKRLREEFASCCVVKEFFGTESFAWTVAIHHIAHIIIGPHGAGLSNVIFSKRDSAVGMIEIHTQYGNWGNNGVNKCHQATAMAAGLKSRLLVQKDGSRFGADFKADIKEVVSAVYDLLEQNGTS